MNCIVVFNKTKDAVLLCKRMKNPYKGCLNFIDGKVELGESSIEAAYRELQKESGITPGQIRFDHFMDITNYYQELVLDATCLAVTAALKAHSLTDTMPENPEKDAGGLPMQMVMPK